MIVKNVGDIYKTYFHNVKSFDWEYKHQRILNNNKYKKHFKYLICKKCDKIIDEKIFKEKNEFKCCFCKAEWEDFTIYINT